MAREHLNDENRVFFYTQIFVENFRQKTIEEECDKNGGTHLY